MAPQIDEQRIDAIVKKVVAELRQERPISNTQSPLPSAPALPGQDGIFPDIDSAISAARVALQQLMAVPVERRDVIIFQMRQAARENAQVLAHEACRRRALAATRTR